MVQIPSVCEAGSADIVDEDEWSFLPAFQREKKGEKGSFICTCNGLKHYTKLVLTYCPYTWLEKEYVIWCKYLPFLKLAQLMSLTRLTGRFYLHFKRNKKGKA